MAGLDVTFGGKGKSRVKLGITGGNTSNLHRVGGCKVTLGISFVPALDPYLRVRPEEMLWITVDNDITYNVYSNLNWNVT